VTKVGGISEERRIGWMAQEYGIRCDDQGRGVLIHHNVVWNCRGKGIVAKGDQHGVYHNTCFDNPRRDILVPRNRLPGKPRELTEQNKASRVFNNGGRVLGNWFWEKPDVPPFAATGHNVKAHLRDAAKLDFRLTPGSSLIDAGAVLKGLPWRHVGNAPDIGAYEYGTTPWRAGYQPKR
jgi:hypothetical protein